MVPPSHCIFRFCTFFYAFAEAPKNNISVKIIYFLDKIAFDYLFNLIRLIPSTLIDFNKSTPHLTRLTSSLSVLLTSCRSQITTMSRYTLLRPLPTLRFQTGLLVGIPNL